MTHEILTTKEAAEYLRITRQTLMKLTHNKKIASNKIEKHYRFFKFELDRFIRKKNRKNNNLIIKNYRDVQNTIDSSPCHKLIPLELCNAGTIPHHKYAKFLCPYYDENYGDYNRLCCSNDESCECICFNGIFNNNILCNSGMPRLVATTENNEIIITTQSIL